MLRGEPLQSCNPAFTYPPIFAFVMIPLVPLPLVLQNLIWYLVTLGSVVGCVILSARMAQLIVPEDWSERDLAWLYGLGVLLNLKFVFATFSNQSYDASVVLLVLGGIMALATDRPMWAGASLACAAALKATPLLFLPYLVAKQHYRAFAVMALILAVACVLPDLIFAVVGGSARGSYLLDWIRQVAQPALTEKLDGNPITFWLASNTDNNSAWSRRNVVRRLQPRIQARPIRGLCRVLPRGGAGAAVDRRRGAICRDRRLAASRQHAVAVANDQPIASHRAGSAGVRDRGHMAQGRWDAAENGGPSPDRQFHSDQRLVQGYCGPDGHLVGQGA